jgi:hypothetical protein
MKFEICREGDDFKVDVDWGFYASKFAGQDPQKIDFEGLGGALLKMNAMMTMTIDGQSANEGVIAFTEAPILRMTFEGQIAPEYCE